MSYLAGLLDEMAKKWPDNRTINLVCHGHSVPSGYFATPFVNTFEAYPHLLHRLIKERFPFAVVNVIVTGVGGETSVSGSNRFEAEVLNHNPDLITIDYGLNDRSIGLEAAASAWKSMIERALSRNIKVILLTPTWDNSYFSRNEAWKQLTAHRDQIVQLAQQYQIGLADSFARFEERVHNAEDLVALLSHANHPTRQGHELVANEIAKYFLAR